MDLSKKINEVATALKAEILAGNFKITEVSKDTFSRGNVVTEIIVMKKYQFNLYHHACLTKSFITDEMAFSNAEKTSFKELLDSKIPAYNHELILSKEADIQKIQSEIESLKAK
ncbi:hypothetical protein LNJ06_12605 [Tenacibaculum finnmarkense genomovar ulcerans]|uniref:hypothetical protein n=1 Tax=Tenacibaculum TaxID=104267 RepID=UPI001E408B88|nr:hypothetical protein [Tenacibaculum finnmarkense]MCD8431009.1 hypothetical protein [Tenacibaculum finnmarkense genomovar ulcerans]